MEQKFGRKNWLIVFIFGLLGQIAWSVENMQFNLFLYNTVEESLESVTLMVQLSGITATVVTLIAGVISDKLRNRRLFISIGYIIWGITVLIFAFISVSNVQTIFKIEDVAKATSLTLTIIIVMDCVMTTFGSTANDACFNAWVTENTQSSFRGKVESVLSVFPLFAMLLVAGGFGILTDLFGYPAVFIALGAIITLSGVLGLFILKDSPELKTIQPTKFSDIIYGFKPSVIKNHKKLYLNLVVVGIYGIACQIFMPFIIIFMTYYLGFTSIQYSLVFGAAIVGGSIVALILGHLCDKWPKERALYLFVVIFAVGLFGMYLTSNLAKPALYFVFGLFGLVMIVGNVLILTLTGALVRDETPEDNVGKLQGIRMIFSVLLPMLLGPMIGNAINKKMNIPLPNPGLDAATTEYIPAPEIFLVAGIVALLSIAVIFIINKLGREKNAE
ncbi:MAG: MFS transporter [Clostridia bacterium]|nr:MFS transporter [Clostridia bacterium]